MQSTPNPFAKNLIIYHANCSDGFAAAWAAWTKFGNSDTEYVPMAYGENPFEIAAFVGMDVYIVDFSFPREALVAMCKLARKVVILDHHKTAQADLTDWPEQPANLEIHFDMHSSGAMMSWEYFRHLDPVPDLIKYVQDRDLWKKELPHSEEITAFISTLPHNFDAWTSASHLIRNRFNEAKNIGMSVLARHNQIVTDIVNSARTMRFFLPDGIELVGLAANCTGHFASDVGNELCKASKTFGATYCAGSDGSVKWSLRSQGDYDVSAIAKMFGGGGHKNAAGFTLKEAGRDTEREINIWVGESHD